MAVSALGLLGVVLTLTAVPVFAQQSQAPPPIQEQKPPSATLTSQAPPSDGKIRIYVTDSQSWVLSMVPVAVPQQEEQDLRPRRSSKPLTNDARSTG